MIADVSRDRKTAKKVPVKEEKEEEKRQGQVGKKAQAPKQKRNRERSKGTERQLITIGDRAVCPRFSVAQSALYAFQRLGPSLFFPLQSEAISLV